jgi:DNA-binding NtrC family response regulator
MNTNKQSILIVDDEESIRKLLRGRFEREGYQVYAAENADDALVQLKTRPEISVVVTDFKMPRKDGIELLKEIKANAKSPKVIMMTGNGEKSTAINALRFGASEYIEKPFEMEEMVHSVKRTYNEYRLERENEDFVSRLEARVARVEGKAEDQYWFVSKAKAMEPVNEWLKVLQRESMRSVNQNNVDEPTTLIVGESGTGKEGIARMIHAGSKRAKGPWIAINCANFNDQLLESELFGHEKGSFTGANTQKRGLFELAKGGTLFLDEIGEMDIKLQAKILRVLQERTFRRVGGSEDLTADVRFVAATNQNLGQYIAEGKFRDDLYHRLSRVVIEIPALRNRTEDVVPMSELFFERAFTTRGKHFEGMTTEAKALIQTYRWPGNVRELLNVVERTALLWSKTGMVDVEDISIPDTFSNNTPPTPPKKRFDYNEGYRPGISTNISFQNSGSMNFTNLKKKWSDDFEKEYLENLLSRMQGNVTAAAKESGIDRSNFLRLLRRHHINAQNFRGVTTLKQAA